MKEFIEKTKCSLKKVASAIEQKTCSELLNEDKEIDLSCYYKLPMFFLETNNPVLAKKILDFIFRRFLMPDGDFKAHCDFKSTNPIYVQFWSYFNGWILRAANLLSYPSSYLELSQQYFQAARLGEGKIFTHNPIEKNYNTDVLTIAHHGLVYLESGKKEWSREAAEFLQWAFNSQQCIDAKFHLRFNREAKVIQEYPESQQMLFSVEKNYGENQLYFMLAYPCAFLSLYYERTKDKVSLEYAKHYMSFLLSCGEGIYSSRFSHKTAWAASILYAQTGEDIYLTVVEKIVNYFIKIQSEDGLWFKEEGPFVYFDQSSEIGCWFSQILKNISSLTI